MILCVLAWLLRLGVASASVPDPAAPQPEPAASNDPCIAAYALEDVLHEDEQRALLALCRTREGSLPAGTLRAAGTIGWKQELIGRLAHGEPPARDDVLFRRVRELEACRPFARELAAMSDPNAMLDVEVMKRCSPSELPADRRMLIVLGPPHLERVRVVNASDGTLSVGAEIFAPPRGTDDARTFSAWVVLPASDKKYSVVAESPRWSVPLYRDRQGGPIVDLRGARQGCLRVELATSGPTLVLLDGRKIAPEREITVPVLDTELSSIHPRDLTVLQPIDHGWRRMARWSFQDEDFKSSGTCERVAFDLRELKYVTLLEIPASPACSAVGVNRESVWQAAKDYLVDMDQPSRFRDFRGTMAMLDAMKDLEDGLRPEAGAGGASRSEYELGQLIRRGAGDLWHQGVSTVYGITLECSEVPGSPVTLVASKWDLEQLLRATTTDNPPEVLDSKSEVVPDVSRLEPATRRALHRLHERPYLTMIAPDGPRRLHEKIDVTVELHGLPEDTDGTRLLQDGRVCVRAWELPPEGAARVCSQIASTGRVHGDEFPIDRLGRRLAVGMVREPTDDSGARLALLGFRVWPRRAGWVLVQGRYFDGERDKLQGDRPEKHADGARLRQRMAIPHHDDATPQDEVYACVEVVEDAPWNAWAEGTYAWSWRPFDPTLARARGDASSQTLRMRFGLDRVVPIRTSPVGFTLGLLAGYSRRALAYERSPSWDDLPSAGEGTTASELDDAPRWTRHGLLVGAKLGFALVGCARAPKWNEPGSKSKCSGVRRHIRLWIDAAPAFDLGIIDARDTPTELDAFRGRASGNVIVDGDFDMGLSVGVGTMISPRLWLAFTPGIELTGLDDLFEEASVVTQDAGYSWVFGIRMGVLP